MISLIFPTYNEEENIPKLLKEVDKVTRNLKITFEYVFIDDCSTDKTFEILKISAAKNKRIKIIRFARNFGSHAAITAGINSVSSDALIVLATDLQDPPEIIIKLVEQWKKGSQIVWGIRTSRQGEKRSTKFFSKLYYSLVNWLTIVKMPPQGADVFLIDKVVINAFKKIPEKHSSVFMLLSWLGFKQTSVSFVKRERLYGKSKWSLSRKIKLVVDSVLSFSDIPIRYSSIIGIITALIGFIYATFITYTYIFNNRSVEGWTIVLIAILIIAGIQMSILGILGEYLWRTFDESRHRPQYIIEKTVNITNN